jgi:hypothetical protein
MFIQVRTKPGIKFIELVSVKSLDLAVRCDSFASEPNKKVPNQSGGGTSPRNTSQSRRGRVVRCGEHPPPVGAKDRAMEQTGVASQSG